MEKRIGPEVAILSNMIKRQLPHDHRMHHENHRMTHMHGKIIHFLWAGQRKGDLFQRDIEKEFSIRRSTATNILQLMEQNELIRREPVPYDARLKKIVLTENAFACHQNINYHMKELERKLRQGISEEELAVFFRVMQKMKANLDPEHFKGDDI